MLRSKVMNKKALTSYIIAGIAVATAQMIVGTFTWTYFIVEVVIAIAIWNIIRIFFER